MDANTPATQSFPDNDPLAFRDHDPVAFPDNDPLGHAKIQDSPSTPEPGASAPPRPKGPNGSAVVLGLAALLLAAVIIANESMSLRVDWSRLGPGAIVGIGVLFVALGAIGLVRRHDDA